MYMLHVKMLVIIRGCTKVRAHSGRLFLYFKMLSPCPLPFLIPFLFFPFLGKLEFQFWPAFRYFPHTFLFVFKRAHSGRSFLYFKMLSPCPLPFLIQFLFFPFLGKLEFQFWPSSSIIPFLLSGKQHRAWLLPRKQSGQAKPRQRHGMILLLPAFRYFPHTFLFVFKLI